MTLFTQALQVTLKVNYPSVHEKFGSVKKPKSLDKLNKAMRSLRENFEESSLAWTYDTRLVPVKLFSRVIDQIHKDAEALETAVNKFVTDDYPLIREHLIFRSNGVNTLFSMPQHMLREYGPRLAVETVTDVEDVIADLPESVQDRLGLMLQTENDWRINRAKAELLNRLKDTLDRLVSGLTNSRVYDKTFADAQRFANLGCKLNLFGLEVFDNSCNSLKNLLNSTTPAVLRSEPGERAKVLAEAKRIYESV